MNFCPIERIWLQDDFFEVKQSNIDNFLINTIIKIVISEFCQAGSLLKAIEKKSKKNKIQKDYQKSKIGN
ncbi:hypothetical protein BpHYR1_019416 [Brachionus plicatilis]|uniref:Uncharacterized protein n=1 Tax=Brachionus plicatilis TaxID=10195 RepID=A0A3M7RDF9_BRAPC|nr:hypothetical protein BpHYR1_019416 [Brachionus plicatilis]